MIVLPPAAMVVAISAYFALGTWKGTSPNLPRCISDPLDGTLWMATPDLRARRVILEAKRHYCKREDNAVVDVWHLYPEFFEGMQMAAEPVVCVTVNGLLRRFEEGLVSPRELMEIAGSNPETHFLAVEDGELWDRWDNLDAGRELRGGMKFHTCLFTQLEEEPQEEDGEPVLA